MGVAAVILLMILLPSSIKVLREYERGVVFRFGCLSAKKGPGIFLIIPFVDKMIKVDLRTVTLDVAPLV